jgi:hypothetical protein
VDHLLEPRHRLSPACVNLALGMTQKRLSEQA